MATIKQAFSQELQVRDMGELGYFLGVKVVQDQDTGNIWIGQESYIESILRRFGMENCKTIRTPVDASKKLVKVVDNDTDIDKNCSSQLWEVYSSQLWEVCFIHHLLLDQILPSL